MTTHDEPAYPASHTNERTGEVFSYSGLTKRELFAMAAMQGLLTAADIGWSYEKYAAEAVKHADALIGALGADDE